MLLDYFEKLPEDDVIRFLDEQIKTAEKKNHDRLGFHIQIVKKFLSVMMDRSKKEKEDGTMKIECTEQEKEMIILSLADGVNFCPFEETRGIVCKCSVKCKECIEENIIWKISDK